MPWCIRDCPRWAIDGIFAVVWASQRFVCSLKIYSRGKILPCFIMSGTVKLLFSAFEFLHCCYMFILLDSNSSSWSWGDFHKNFVGSRRMACNSPFLCLVHCWGHTISVVYSGTIWGSSPGPYLAKVDSAEKLSRQNAGFGTHGQWSLWLEV